jgi:hypothetical protein
MVNPSTHLENDEFGYSCYAIVSPAPPSLAAPLLGIESAAGQQRAKIPAHVTVKGTLYAIASLNGMIEAIRDVVRQHKPFVVGVEGMEILDSEHSVKLSFPANPQIQALHDDLVARISPLGKPAYKDDPYRVHMSIVNEVQPEGVAIAKSKVAEIDFGDGMQMDSVDLWARDGVAWGGTWHRLERFELSAG